MKIYPLIVACLAAYPLAAQVESGSAFRVHVVNSVTGSPIGGANVVLDHENGEKLWGRTDAAGVFRARSQTAGSHVLNVTHHGYRMTGSGMGRVVEAKAEGETDVTAELQPLGALAGRILDQYGDPVRHAIVRTEDKVSAPDGEEGYQQQLQTIAANTDRRRAAGQTLLGRGVQQYGGRPKIGNPFPLPLAKHWRLCSLSRRVGRRKGSASIRRPG